MKYGVTAEYVLGLDVVLADGGLLTTGRRTAKGVAGYDLTRLFVGSEGSLGIVVGAVLALKPAPPEQLVLAAEFPSTAVGLRRHLPDHGARPRSLAAGTDGPYDHSGRQRDGQDGPSRDHRGAAAGRLRHPGPGRRPGCGRRALQAAGATEVVPAEDAAESDMLLQARRLTLTALEAGQGGHDDRRRLRAALPARRDDRRHRAAIAEKHRLTIGVVAHAGDGNTHPTVCFDAADPDETRRARESFDEIMALGLELGGTITGEHGVGVLKKEWLARELGPVAWSCSGASRRSSTRSASSTRARSSDG